MSKNNIKKRIFFMHIGKCGGTSIVKALQEHYEFPYNSKKKFIQLSAIKSREAAEYLGRKKSDYRNDLLFYFMSDPKNCCITGHFRFNNQLHEIFGNQFSFITILREPISHFFSSYFYDRYKSNTECGRVYDDLETFVSTSQAASIGSRYIQFLVEGYYPNDPVSETILNIAKRNLEKFNLVGTLDSLPLFQRCFQEYFGKRLLIPHVYKSPKPKNFQTSDINPMVLEKIKEICQPNKVVYDFAAKELIHLF